MKVIFTSHCQDDWYENVGARKLKNSAQYFHPDIDMVIHGDKTIAEIRAKYPWSTWYTFDPLVAEYHLDNYDMIVHFDADSIITGPLDELLEGDFDIAGVRNNNDIGITSTTGTVFCSPTPGRNCVTDSLNAGLIASRSKEFWKEFKERNKALGVTGPNLGNYGEQDVFNQIFWEGKYKAKMLDPVGSNVYYGTSQQICEGGVLETAWKRLYMQDGGLYSDGKKVKIIHNANGHRIPKLQYKGWVNKEVEDFLDVITRDRVVTNNNLKIHVLFCDDAIKNSLPPLNNHYEKVDLRDLWKKPGYRYNADGDFFMQELPEGGDYVGVISGRYNAKKPGHATRLEHLYALPMEKNVVWSSYYIDDDWYNYAIKFHPGMEVYLDELLAAHKEIKLKGPVVYAHSFISSVEVYKDWQKFWLYWFNRWNTDKPLNYYHYPQHKDCWNGALMERVTSAYFTMRDDLIIKQIP